VEPHQLHRASPQSKQHPAASKTEPTNRLVSGRTLGVGSGVVNADKRWPVAATRFAGAGEKMRASASDSGLSWVRIDEQRRILMPTIDRDGVEIYYESHGAGPPILLSHGYGATCRMWDGQIAAFSDRHRIIVWDMRGHGDSGDPADPAAYSQGLSVGDMTAVLDACGVERAVIGGLSPGGVMSLAFHLAHPRRVEALMLFDAGPGFRNPDARAAWNERALARARELEEQGLPALSGSGETRLGRHRSARGLAGAARGMLAQFDSSLIDSLPAIGVPSLLLVGSEDKNFLAATDYMAGKIPRARKVVIPGAGHAANLDQPAAFDRALQEFLAALSSEPLAKLETRLIL
jgi:pimeloyl-ACP methyl ester carboxylesterase